jgi:DNA-binding transcriptional LysR family regulator
VDSVKGLQRGTVELVTMPSPGIEPLGALTQRFTRRYPGITVKVAAAFTPAEVAEKVKQGSFELGLVGTPGPLSTPGIDVLQLEEQPFVLVGGPDAAFPNEDPVPHAKLAGARMVVSPVGSLMRQIVDDFLAEGAEMQIVAEVAHRTSILPLVLGGVGLAVLPSAWAPLARRAGARTARLDPTAHLQISVLSRQAPLTPAARAFLAVARAHKPVDHLSDSITESEGSA